MTARHRSMSSIIRVSRKGTADALRKLRALTREIRMLRARIHIAQGDQPESSHGVPQGRRRPDRVP
jgi:hypothetical protein